MRMYAFASENAMAARCTMYWAVRLAKKAQQPKRKKHYFEEFAPIWFQLPERFYRKLKGLAADRKTSMPEVLQQALRLVEKQWKEEKRRAQNPDLPADATPSKLVSFRWSKTSPEERSKIAKQLSERRWAKARQKPSNQTNQR